MAQSAVVADIGGTHARFGLIGVEGRLEKVSVLQCADFRGLEEAYRHFSEQTSSVADRLAVAVACPVHQDLVKLTNNHWSFRKGDIVDSLGLTELLTINDFTAQSLAVVSVPESSFEVLQPGMADPLAPLFVIGPGTGLGVGGVVVDADGEWTPLSTEGGHVTMAAQTEDEWQLLSCLRREFPHVSAERLISGPGLHLMYRTLCVREGQPVKALDTASMMLIAETDLLVQRTLDLFAGFFGIVASDGCLTLGATGGCFVAGGVIPKLGTHFRREIFLDRFKAKGRFHQYLSHIPIKILLDSEAGLYGLQRALSTRSLARFSVRPQQMRIGILGFGKIAREALYPAILNVGHSVTAIGSAAGVKPDGFQGEVFSDYSDVITSGLIDAVYIALPNHLHYPMSRCAIEAGIPVLCEKPLGLSAAEVSSLSVVAETQRSFLMEALMVAHHPQWQWIRQHISTDEPLHLSVQFHYDNRDPLNIRNRPETGGGARLDIGCYALWVAHWLGARTLTGATGCQWIEQGVDARTSGRLLFDEHLELQFDVSMRRARFQQVIIHSQKHCWVIPRPFNPSANTTIWAMGSEGIEREHQFEAMQYERMIEAFSTSIDRQSKTDLTASQRIAQWSDTIKHQFEERIVK